MDTMHLKDPLVLFGYEGSSLSLPLFLLSHALPLFFKNGKQPKKNFMALNSLMCWCAFKPSFIHSDNKAAAAAAIDYYSSIDGLPDRSSIYSAELHALYLAFDRVETADDDERNIYHFLSFEVCSSGHFRPRLDAYSCPQGTVTRLLANTVPRENDFLLLGSQSGWH